MTEQSEMTIDSRLAVRINAGILCTIIGVSIAAAFAFADIQNEVGGVGETLKEVEQSLKEMSRTQNAQALSAALRGKALETITRDIESLERRVKVLEDAK